MTNKKILLIEDISCFGKCSVTVALPIMAAAGVEASVLPTAIFSTHTGISKEAVKVNFSEQMKEFTEHWDKTGISFDGILTGYAAGEAQLKIMGEYLKRHKNIPSLIDPAMADNGKLYGGFSENYVSLMKEFCAYADYITPNLTEAAMLAGTVFHEPPYERTEIFEILNILQNKYKNTVIITGVKLTDGSFAVIGNSKEVNPECAVPYVEKNYSGTGDAFAAIFFAKIMTGSTFETALESAARLTSDAVCKSFENGADNLYFEAILGELTKERV